MIEVQTMYSTNPFNSQFNVSEWTGFPYDHVLQVESFEIFYDIQYYGSINV